MGGCGWWVRLLGLRRPGAHRQRPSCRGLCHTDQTRAQAGGAGRWGRGSRFGPLVRVMSYNGPGQGPGCAGRTAAVQAVTWSRVSSSESGTRPKPQTQAQAQAQAEAAEGSGASAGSPALRTGIKLARYNRSPWWQGAPLQRRVAALSLLGHRGKLTEQGVPLAYQRRKGRPVEGKPC